MTAGVCRVCDCTEEQACFVLEGRRLTDAQLEEFELTGAWPSAPIVPCTWIEPDLCSACVEEPVPPPLLYDAHGRALRGAP